jgi:hypothetical protein
MLNHALTILMVYCYLVEKWFHADLDVINATQLTLKIVSNVRMDLFLMIQIACNVVKDA